MLFNFFKKRTSQKLFDKGMQLYRSKKTGKAIEELSIAIKMESNAAKPDNNLLSNAYNIRGEVYLSVGVAILSQSDFVHALQYNPNNENALNNLGIWFSIPQFSNPDYKTSLDYFDKALAIQPNRNDIRLNKACVKIQSGDASGCDDLRQLEQEGYTLARTALERFCSRSI